ncbi:YceI family protein [Elizabethkingia ursingii]|uniref:YceI family protein n=1 Tax=Elizabethkingia ursingii TaxID=1756150 RepID=UPI0007510321|nr:YceI family protein [Elizabethkingia ursingii]KUY29796.1 hypothetical protein ATB96_17815 [Elizabethkingia ursingii]
MKNIWLGASIFTLLVISCKKNETVDFHTTTSTSRDTESISHENKELKYKLTWIAFKYPEPEKIGVNGSFTDIKLENSNNKGVTIEETLGGVNFSINTETVNSGAADRDVKLKTFFFQKMGGTVKGSFGKFEKAKVPVKITMNNISKDIPFTYEKNGDTLVVKGKIDIIDDFKANDALKAISDACKDLHKNKTWSDVEIITKFYK